MKEKILGKEVALAFERDEVELKDFVGWKPSKEFGKSVYTKQLSLVLQGKGIEPESR
mgnify:FL=1